MCGTYLPAQIVSFNKHVDSCIVKGDVVEPETLMSEVKEAPNIIKSVPGLQLNHSDKGSGMSIALSSIKSGDMGGSDQRGKKRKSLEEGPALQKFIGKIKFFRVEIGSSNTDILTFDIVCSLSVSVSLVFVFPPQIRNGRVRSVANSSPQI